MDHVQPNVTHHFNGCDLNLMKNGASSLPSVAYGLSVILKECYDLFSEHWGQPRVVDNELLMGPTKGGGRGCTYDLPEPMLKIESHYRPPLKPNIFIRLQKQCIKT